ncbi:MAG TPA: hypothetical protein VJG83_03785 [archaeon]|nr:hypothetical protein [archaeon]
MGLIRKMRNVYENFKRRANPKKVLNMAKVENGVVKIEVDGRKYHIKLGYEYDGQILNYRANASGGITLLSRGQRKVMDISRSDLVKKQL